MSYEDTINYLFSQMPMFEKHGAAGYKAGLENTLALDAHFGHPHRNYKTIHIAGTNGKGSCSHSIAAVLQQAGYRVGLYTSPHLVDFRERIRVNGQPVSEAYVTQFVETERSFFEPLHPSFFEVTTALAFKYFSDAKVDIAVIEVGLGGRIDCTNIITPLLSVITNISFDHTQFLGDTLAKIAGEKAGIIKRGVPVVIGETNSETRPVFEAVARRMNAPITFAEDTPEVLSSQSADGGFDYETRSFGSYHGDLGGFCQPKNTNTVLTALASEPLSALLPRDQRVQTAALGAVCPLTGLRGRWERVGQKPLVICDTGHNVGGWTYLSAQISAVECRQLRMVFGMVGDKDVDGVLSLMPRNAQFYFTQPDNHRAMPAETLKEKALRHGLHGECFPTVTEAYAHAIADATAADFVFVGGSSYVVADFLTHCV